jgi:acetyl-CoA carboxylase biotin carboxyl carrier protein
MSDTKLTQDDVQQILRLIESAEHVAEFHLKYGDVEIGLSRTDGESRPGTPASAPARLAPAPAPAPQAAPAARSAKPTAPAASAVPAGAAVVKAPMVGTFYRAPAPGAPPFVEVGGKVEPDTVVCIIEVMKLMNSIPAGVRGTVREIRVGDAEPVEFGQVLVVIEPER